jgi:hypothetical protein
MVEYMQEEALHFKPRGRELGGEGLDRSFYNNLTTRSQDFQESFLNS